MADGVSVSFLLFFFCFTFESDGFDEGRGMKTKKKSARQIFFCFFSTQNTNKCVKQCSTCCYGRLLLIFCCCSCCCCCCCCCCWTDFPRNWKGFVLFFSLGKGGGGFFFFMFCCSPKRKRRQGNPQNLSAEIPRISEPQIAQFPRFFFFFFFWSAITADGTIGSHSVWHRFGRNEFQDSSLIVPLIRFLYFHCVVASINSLVVTSEGSVNR